MRMSNPWHRAPHAPIPRSCTSNLKISAERSSTRSSRVAVSHCLVVLLVDQLSLPLQPFVQFRRGPVVSQNMDPELEGFLRRPVQELNLQHTASLDETITAVAVAELAAGNAIVAVGQADTATIVLLDGSLSPLRELQGHAGGTNALGFGGSSRLVSAGEDGTAAVWDPQSGELLARLKCEGENTDRSSKGHTVSHAVCNTAGTLAACAAGRTLHAFELTTDDYETRRRVFPAVSGGVIEDVKFVGDTRVLCSYYGGVVLHSTEPGGYGVLLEYGTNVLSAAALPDMSYIVGGCLDSCVHIWNFQTSPEVAAAARAMAKASIAGGPRNSAPDDSTSEEGGSELVEYSCGGYSAKVTSTVFNSDHSMLATLGGTQCIVWDFTGPQGPAGSRPVIGLGHTKTVTCQAWQPMPQSPFLVTGGKDGRVLVYDISEYAEPPPEAPEIPNLAAPTAVAPDPDLRDEVTAVCWSAVDSKLLYAAHASGELRCWQLEPEVRPAEVTPAEVTPAEVTSAEVTSAEVRPADKEAEEKAEEDSEESEQTVQIVQ